MYGRNSVPIAALAMLVVLFYTNAMAQVPALSQADEAYALGNYAAAFDSYRSLVESDPGNTAALLGLARSCAGLADWPQAARAYQTLDRIQPLSGPIRQEYADSLREAGRLDEAITQYNLVLNAGSTADMLAKADAARQSGDNSSAINLYWEILSQDRGNAAAWCGLGQANTQSGNYREAVSAFKQADELGGIVLEARQAYGDALRETGDAPGALAQYDLVVAGGKPTATNSLNGLHKSGVMSGADTQVVSTPVLAVDSKPEFKPYTPRPVTTSFSTTTPSSPTVFYQSRSREVNTMSSAGDDEDDAEPEPSLSPSQWLTRARDHAENDEWTDAVDAYQQVIDGGGDSVEVRLEYANALREVDQIGMAKMEYNRLLHADAGNIEAKLGLAKVIAQDGDLEEAMYLLDQLAMNPDAFSRARLARAWCYLINDYTQECWRDIGDMLAINPENSQAVEMIMQRQPNEDTWLEIRSLLLGVPGNEETVELIEEIMAQEERMSLILPDDPVGRADALYHRGRYDEARREYEKLVQRNPMDSRGWLRLGNLYVFDEDWDEAIASYEQYLTSVPSDYEARLHYAQALMWSGDGQAAVEELESMISSVDIPIDTYEQALVAYAVALSAVGRHEEARRWFEEALIFLPHNIEARVSYASSLAAAGAHNEAIVQYRAALKEDPTNEQAKLGLAQTYAWKGDNKMARQLYDELNIGGKQYAAAKVGAAYTYLWEGDRATAMQLADEIALLEPDNPAVAQLYRELKYVGEPKFSTTVTQSHDRDDNDYSGINTLISVPVDAVGSQLTISNEDFKLDNTNRNEESAGVHTRVSISMPVDNNSRIYANVGYLDIDNGSVGSIDNWTWGAAYRVKVTDTWNAGIGYYDHVMYDTTQLARNDLNLREWAVNSDWQIFDRDTRLFTQASWGKISDGNKRATWTVNLQRTARWPGSGRMNYGLAFRGLDYSKDLDSGYWDPDNYRYAEIFADWFDESNHDILVDTGFGWGVDDATSSGGGSVLRYYIGLRSYLFEDRFLLKAGYKGSESSNDDITGPGYEMRSWYLTGEFNF